MKPGKVLVIEYLAARLLELNSSPVFSLSGDYCEGLLANIGLAEVRINEAVHPTPSLAQLKRVGNTTEQEAAYCAEGYAKASPGSIGVVCTTYGQRSFDSSGVGTFNTLNGIASAFVERVPVVILNGSPSESDFRNEENNGILYHHMIFGERTAERNAFVPVTASQHILGSAEVIPLQIDEALATAMSRHQPVYLEVPEEKWTYEGALYTL